MEELPSKSSLLNESGLLTSPEQWDQGRAGCGMRVKQIHLCQNGLLRSNIVICGNYSIRAAEGGHTNILATFALSCCGRKKGDMLSET